MKGYYAAIWTESLKVRRSAMFWIILLIFVFVAFVTGLLVYLAKHPDLISNSAVISAKATIIGNADWAAYFGLLNQIVAMIGLIGFGFVASWVFGREYTDRTVKDLLALPVSRSKIVMAKFVIVLIWCILLSVIIFVVGILAGFIFSIEGWSIKEAIHALRIYTVTSILTILLCTPLAIFASLSRGFLLPLGFLILALIMSQFIGIGTPGIAPYFPWSVPAIYNVVASTQDQSLTFVSYLVVFVTSLLGIVITIAWWLYADQK